MKNSLTIVQKQDKINQQLHTKKDVYEKARDEYIKTIDEL